jgi:hypothetical protein
MFGVEARFAALPIIALVIPWRCNLLAPSQDAGLTADLTSALLVGEPALATSSNHAAPPGAPRAALSVAAPRPAESRTSPGGDKRERTPSRVSTGALPEPTASVATLPDEIVVRVMGTAQPEFLRCWARAQRNEGLDGAKIRMHLEIDAHGKVIATSSDAESPTLSRCLAAIARQLPFPAPGMPAVVELPLMFR